MLISKDEALISKNRAFICGIVIVLRANIINFKL